MNDNWMEHPVLEGPRIRLEPLADAHVEGLLKAADDPDTIFAWAHLVIRDLDDARTFVREAVADPSRLPTQSSTGRPARCWGRHPTTSSNRPTAHW